MAAQTVFRRYELKYMLTEAERGALLACMADDMVPDRYGVWRTDHRHGIFGLR